MEKYWGLLSVFGVYSFDCFCLSFYRGGSEAVGEISLTINFRAKCWGFSSIQSSQSYLRSPLSFQFSDCFSVRNSAGYCLSLSSLWQQGLRHFWRECFALVSSVPGSHFLDLYSHRTLTRRFRWDAPLLSDRIFGIAVFTYVMWGGEDKIEITEEFVSNVLRF